MSTTASTADQPEQQERAGERQVSEERHEQTILSLMLCDEHCLPWSVEELARAIGDHLSAVDAVDRLQAAGLVHSVGVFVFPTLAARRADAISTENV